MRDLYAEIKAILGSTGVIIPIGDARYEATDATTVTTQGDGGSFVFTYAGGPARTAFDRPTYFTRNRYKIPIVPFNGSDEYATSPDAAYWSGTADGTAPNEPAYSIGGWFYLRSLATATKEFLSKWVETTLAEQREVFFGVDTDGAVAVNTYDESADAFIGRVTALGSVVINRWTHVVLTKTTGVTNGAHELYLDGVAASNADQSGGVYTAMENTTGRVLLGATDGAAAVTRFFNGEMAGGPLGPFFTQIALTAQNVRDLFAIGREGLFSREPLWLPGRV